MGVQFVQFVQSRTGPAETLAMTRLSGLAYLCERQIRRGGGWYLHGTVSNPCHALPLYLTQSVAMTASLSPLISKTYRPGVDTGQGQGNHWVIERTNHSTPITMTTLEAVAEYGQLTRKGAERFLKEHDLTWAEAAC